MPIYKKIRKNTLFSIVLFTFIELMSFFSCSVTANAAEIIPETNTWSALQNAINDAGSGDTITLTADVTARDADTALVIPDGAVLTLDLNGHTIDRNMKENPSSEGAAFSVQSGAMLTVTDSSEAVSGKITGGYAKDGGGFRNFGTLIFAGGCVSGNLSKVTGGGILNCGVLVLSGGTVTENSAGTKGGGIYNDVNGYMTADKYSVYGNNAQKDADICNAGSMKTIGGKTVDHAALKFTYDMLTVLPALVLLIVLSFAASVNKYLDQRRKRTMYIIMILAFTLVINNYFDTWFYESGKWIMLRTINSIYGYAVRPAILAMFLHIINPDMNYKPVWVAVGANAALYMTALFSPLTFSYPYGYFIPGPLNYTCLIVSAVLFFQCFYLTMRVFRPKQRKETWIPVFVLVLISLSVVLDYTVIYTETPVSFLTMAIILSSIMYYFWLYLQFVREHERELQAEHRIQIMMTQIQPHFLFNTLNSVMALCTKDAKAARQTLGLFSVYLRQNLESLETTELIPLSKELEHTRVYTEIEMIRFPNIRIEYDIRDEEFKIPALTVQPLVENAIRHGVRSLTVGIVRVSTYREENEHLIVIEDNGAGFEKKPAEASDGTHIGIVNVRERLERMCGGRMEINSMPGEGTKIVLRIPAGEELNR